MARAKTIFDNYECIQKIGGVYVRVPTLSSCVCAMKVLTGYRETVGDAKNWPTQPGAIPMVGSVVVVKGSLRNTAGHVFQIKILEPTRWFIADGNGISGQYSERWIEVTPQLLSTIIGFDNSYAVLQ